MLTYQNSYSPRQSRWLHTSQTDHPPNDSDTHETELDEDEIRPGKTELPDRPLPIIDKPDESSNDLSTGEYSAGLPTPEETPNRSPISNDPLDSQISVTHLEPPESSHLLAEENPHLEPPELSQLPMESTYRQQLAPRDIAGDVTESNIVEGCRTWKATTKARGEAYLAHLQHLDDLPGYYAAFSIATRYG